MLRGFRIFMTAGNLVEVAFGLIMALATFALMQARARMRTATT